MRMPREEIGRYGVIAPRGLGGNVYEVQDLVEKPDPKDAPSDLAIIGRYVLTPDIFPILADTPPDSRGEIQLTNGLRVLRGRRVIYAVEFEGSATTSARSSASSRPRWSSPRAPRSGGRLRELPQNPRALASSAEGSSRVTLCFLPNEKSLVASDFARHEPTLARLTSPAVSGTIAGTPGGSRARMKSQPKRAFHVASEPEIKTGQVSDVYFARTVQILNARGIRKRVKAEVRLKSFPQADWLFGVLAGIEEVAGLLEGLPVNVWAMDEGTLFGAHEPVLVIEGTYVEWAEYETALLGLICQASGIATKAARCKRAAGERQVISFGARRMHPALAPMIERNAFVGGCDGVAVTKSAELIDADPTGTIPHALVLLFGDTVQALQAFHDVVDPKVRRVALIDTLQDEKFEAIRVALRARQGPLRGAARHALLASRRFLPDPVGGPMGAGHPRLRAREDPRLGRDRRVRDPEAEPAGGRLRCRDVHRQRPGPLVRSRYHGDRGDADGQARQAVRDRSRCGVHPGP